MDKINRHVAESGFFSIHFKGSQRLMKNLLCGMQIKAPADKTQRDG